MKNVLRVETATREQAPPAPREEGGPPISRISTTDITQLAGLLAAALLAGCAGVANFPSQPTTYWGFHGSAAQAPSVEAFTWASTEPLCQLLRANQIAMNQKNEREGKFGVVIGSCRSVTVTAGGAWWGFTSGAMAGAGEATPSKEICELLRANAKLPSLCAPVTVR